MLVNDMQENRYQTMPPQWFALWMQIKQFCVVGTVSVSLNPAISLREEVEFNSNSNAIDTHNPNTQGGLKPCMCM